MQKDPPVHQKPGDLTVHLRLLVLRPDLIGALLVDFVCVAGFAPGRGVGTLLLGLDGAFLEGALGGGAVCLVCPGGTARIRHLGPEPMRSSRWALSNASLTR